MKKGVVTEDSYEIFNEQHEHIWNLVTKEKIDNLQRQIEKIIMENL